MHVCSDMHMLRWHDLANLLTTMMHGMRQAGSTSRHGAARCGEHGVVGRVVIVVLVSEVLSWYTCTQEVPY